MICPADVSNNVVYAVANSLEKTIIFFFTKETAQQHYENAMKKYDEDQISPVLRLDSLQEAIKFYSNKEWRTYTEKISHPAYQKIFIQNTITEFSCLDIENLIELSDSLNKAINSRKELMRRLTF